MDIKNQSAKLQETFKKAGLETSATDAPPKASTLLAFAVGAVVFGLGLVASWLLPVGLAFGGIAFGMKAGGALLGTGFIAGAGSLFLGAAGAIVGFGIGVVLAVLGTKAAFVGAAASGLAAKGAGVLIGKTYDGVTYVGRSIASAPQAAVSGLGSLVKSFTKAKERTPAPQIQEKTPAPQANPSPASPKSPQP